MNKLLSIVLLVGGLVLLIVGISVSNSASSEASEFFTGSPTDKAMWMMIGGGVAALVGLVGISGVFGSRRLS